MVKNTYSTCAHVVIAALFGSVVSVMTAVESADSPRPPTVLLQHTPVGIVLLPDGSFAFYASKSPGRDVVLPTPGGAKDEIEPTIDLPLPPGRVGQLMLQDGNGEFHQVFPKSRGGGRPAVTRFIDLWHRVTTGGGRKWGEAKMVWEGYTGALMEYLQLRSGRILVPFGKWIPNRPLAPPTGCHVTIAIYSDDGGKTWTQSRSGLTAPCYAGYNGNNYGACEPAVVELSDGRMYLLMRTQAGFLYESWSADGAEWAEAVPSRFHVSTGPPGLTKLPDGRIALFWNNCEMPPKVDGAGVYGGRDAIHAAISDDEGRTWRGFREVYRDLYRNETPPKRGDRGTAYPYGAFDKDGNILMVSGQGRGRRNFVKIDPDWLAATHHEDDFSQGLDAWHVFKPFGPAVRYWRDRTVGPQLVEHPTRPGAKAMHVRRPDERDPDGATWNFPLGWKGKLSLRLMLNTGSAGASIALGDRMFEPTDDNGERLAIFRLTIDSAGQLGCGGRLQSQTWHTAELHWDLEAGLCQVKVDGNPAGELKQAHPTGNGISYLRLRSTATQIDTVGFLVDRVRADIADPIAPPRTPGQNREAERHYIEQIKGHRDRNTKPTRSQQPGHKGKDRRDAAPVG